MAQGWGTGPVFAYEWLTRSRRWQAFGLRVLFVMVLLGSLAIVWRSAAENNRLTTRQQLVLAGEEFFSTMTIVQLSLVLLAAPAATAGAICLDKARGTLAHVMVTDLSDAEVVLGKLAARLVPVLNLIACALPVAALGTLLGGIDPMALTGSLLIAAGVATLGCSMALTLSVWLTRTHEVLTVIFAAWALWLLALPVWSLTGPGFVAPHWFKSANPFWLALAPYNVPGATTLVEPIAFLVTCLAISAGLAALAVARVRPVYIAQSGRSPRSSRNWRPAAWLRRWPGPSLDANPVLWREWHKSRPSRWTRVVWGLYGFLSTVLSLLVIYRLWTNPTVRGPANEIPALLNSISVSVGLLLLSASAATVLSEERVRGSLDVLLTTPLSTRSIVWGKWWGAFRRAPWLAFWPGMVVLAVALQAGLTRMSLFAVFVPALIIAQAAAITSLGLALATWCSRVGRAATGTVSALIVSSVGWPILAMLLLGNGPNNNTREIILMAVLFGSPFYSIAMSTIALSTEIFANDEEMMSGIVIGATLWTAIYSAIALGLMMATLATFDRCLGRMPEGEGSGDEPDPTRRPGQAQAFKGSGSRTPGAAGQSPVDVASFAPPPR